MATNVDMGGDTLILESLQVGATTPGSTGTALSSTELAYLDTVTAGTVTASKAVVVDSNKDVGTLRNTRTTRVITSGGTPTTLATAGAETITAAQLLTGIIVRDCAGASRIDTLPTAALLVAAIPGCVAGDTIHCKYINGSDANEVITITEGAGGGFDTNQTAASRVIPQNISKNLQIRITVTTLSSEAYVVYL